MIVFNLRRLLGLAPYSFPGERLGSPSYGCSQTGVKREFMSSQKFVRRSPEVARGCRGSIVESHGGTDAIMMLRDDELSVVNPLVLSIPGILWIPA